MRNLIELTDLTANEIQKIFNIADKLNKGEYEKCLEGKTIILFFQSSSIRTRVTFEKGIFDLGGRSFPLDSQTPQMLYSLNEGGSVFYDYITCRKVGKFYAFTQAIIPPSQWEKDKQQIANIILSAKERNNS